VPVRSQGTYPRAKGFRDEADGIFKALHERIQRENQGLYPLAEKI